MNKAYFNWVGLLLNILPDVMQDSRPALRAKISKTAESIKPSKTPDKYKADTPNKVIKAVKKKVKGSILGNL